MNDLEDIFSSVSDILETAAVMGEPQKARTHVIQGLEKLREKLRIPASSGRKSDGKRATFIHWQVCCLVYDE